MKYLLDTCVISELVKKRPSQALTKWLSQQDEFSLFMSVITIGELQKGIGKLPESNRRLELQEWVANDLLRRFTGRILNIDLSVAEKWGEISAASEKTGRPVPVLDGLLMATAQSFGLTFVTRNISHVETTDASLFNPWQE